MIIQTSIESSYCQIFFLAKNTDNLPYWSEDALDLGIALTQNGMYITTLDDCSVGITFTDDQAFIANNKFLKEVRLTSPDKIFVLNSLNGSDEIILESEEQSLTLRIYVNEVDMYEVTSIVFITDACLEIIEHVLPYIDPDGLTSQAGYIGNSCI